MEKKNIVIIVAEFLSAQTINFSEDWKGKLVKRCKEKETSIPKPIHEEMLLEMMRKEDKDFNWKFSSISETDSIEIRGNAVDKWTKYFDATKSKAKQPESHYYQICLRSAQIDWYTKTTESKKDENGDPIVDERGKVIRVSKIPTTPLSVNDNNNTDENEESEYDGDFESNDYDFDKIESTDTVSLDEPIEKYTFLDYLKENFRWYYEYFDDSVKSEETKSLPDGIFEIRNHLLLSGQIKMLNRNEPIRRVSKPSKDSKLYPHKPEFDNLSDDSANALHLFQYLKNAEK